MTKQSAIEIHKSITRDERDFHAGIKLAVEGCECPMPFKSPKWYGWQAGQEMRFVKSKWLTAMRENNTPALVHADEVELVVPAVELEPLPAQIENLPPKAFLDAKNLKTKFDNPEMQLVLYNYGLQIGKDAAVVFVNERNVWSAVKKDGTLDMRSERLGHHPNLQYSWQGILDSNVKLVIWRRFGFSVKAFECLPAMHDGKRLFVKTEI